MLQSYKNERARLLSAFTIGELDNPVTAKSITEKLELLDNVYKAWIDFFFRSEFPKAEAND